MITVNDSVQLPTADCTEAYKLIDGTFEKLLIVRFPRADFSRSRAVETMEEAQTVTAATYQDVRKYFVTEIVGVEEDALFTRVRMRNPETELSGNLSNRVQELEAVVNELIGGENA